MIYFCNEAGKKIFLAREGLLPMVGQKVSTFPDASTTFNRDYLVTEISHRINYKSQMDVYVTVTPINPPE